MGPTPQVNMAKVQITVSVNPGFHAILLGIFKNAKYFDVITVDGSWVVIIILLQLESIRILCLYFPFYDFEDYTVGFI